MSEFRANDEDGWRQGQDPTARQTSRTAAHNTAAPNTMAVPPPPKTSPAISASAAPARRSLLRRGLRLLLRGLGLATLAVLALIVAYRFINPPASALMLLQRAGGEIITQRWVPLDKISPHLVRAVIMSEDAGFCRHFGIDLNELKTAIDNAQDGVVRGGSTISMQTAKNLFLWPSRSYVRKAIEIPLTLTMEAVWPKARLLEIYLNIVEWGPGIFGAEAAARHHFKKPASRLDEREAALLAVSLPAPLVREPGRPSALLQRMGRTIEQRMKIATRHSQCVLGTPG